MRHSQDDLLIIKVLTLFAHEYNETPTEDHAFELAAEIADQHGLTVTEAIEQREQKRYAYCWD